VAGFNGGSAVEAKQRNRREGRGTCGRRTGKGFRGLFANYKKYRNFL
jgi:hypothetical protein